MMGFEEMEPVFGQLKAEWCSAPQQTTPLEPFLFLAGPLPNNPSTLRIHRDSIGIGGSWSEFVEYVVASIKSDDVKLVMEGESKSGGAAYAKLIAQKAKGMPRISVSLVKLVDVNASEAMANLSLELYKAYKNMHISLIKEETRCCQLTNRIAAEQAKSETLQKQLNSMLFSKRQKLQKMNDDTSDGVLVMPSQDSPDKQAAQIPASTKATTRVVPAYRRAKVRGVFLQDSDDDDA